MDFSTESSSPTFKEVVKNDLNKLILHLHQVCRIYNLLQKVPFVIWIKSTCQVPCPCGSSTDFTIQLVVRLVSVVNFSGLICSLLLLLHLVTLKPCYPCVLQFSPLSSFTGSYSAPGTALTGCSTRRLLFQLSSAVWDEKQQKKLQGRVKSLKHGIN